MGFFLVGFIVWGLIIASVIFMFWGLWKKSAKAFVWSGITSLIPTIMLATQKGWFILFLIWPLIAFVAAYFTGKRSKSRFY